MSRSPAPWPDRADQIGPVSADALHDLAERIDRLTISRRDPHAFHEAKSEIAHDLRRLAEEARR